MELTLDQLLKKMVEYDASDLHVSAGNPPIIRISGKLTRLKGYPALTPEMVEGILTGILSKNQNQRLVEDKEIDFSYAIPGARFRGNVFMERQSLAGAFRMIPPRPKTMQELGVPGILRELAMKRQGLILVTGPSGSGKSTTLAAAIEHMNDNRNAHIVTIEDPIEYTFKNRTCLIHQREVGPHTHSFSGALRSVLRQDPDIIMVGEMRDKETVETALLAAETGHLVLSTLHTNNAVDSVHRILDFFGEDQAQVRFQLAATLQAVFSQQLVPHRDKSKGQLMASEVMIVIPAIRNLIREGRVHMIRNILMTGSEESMCTMEAALKRLYDQGYITLETGLAHAFDLQTFRQITGLETKVTSVKYTGKSISDMASKGGSTLPPDAARSRGNIAE